MPKYSLEEQLSIIKRGAVDIFSEAELRKKLEFSIAKKNPLKIKAGFDPTAPDLHLGHTVLLRKLRQFQELGHKVYFLIGDFTGRIGDPSGRSEIRKQLSPQEVAKNAATYKKQVSKILNPSEMEIVFNSKWFAKMTGLEFAQLLTHYTATRMLERDDFVKRRNEGKPIYMSEFIYPILQGFDSVKLEADIEVGGTDQVFNLLVGRDMQRDFGLPQQVVITMPLLEGTDGAQKMSKSYGNYIGINEGADEMFGKIMSISDELMLKYYTLLTDEDTQKLKGIHPKEAKLNLAEIIVSQYHSKALANKARLEFERVFGSRELPQNMPIYKILTDADNIVDILLKSGLVQTKNEARRLLTQGAVNFQGQTITSQNYVINKEGILRAGKRRFLKLVK